MLSDLCDSSDSIHFTYMTAVTRKKYEENFEVPDVPPPVGIALPAGLPPHAILTQWYNFKDEHNHYLWTFEYEVPVPNGRPIKSFHRETFYCEKCKRWLSVGSTRRNLTRHFPVHGDEDPLERKRLQESQGNNLESQSQEDASVSNKPKTIVNDPVAGKKVTQMLIQFLLINSLPFILIEDSFLRTICNTCDRKTLTNYVSLIARLIRNSVKSMLNAAQYVTIAFDEWTDGASRRYIGYTVHCMYEWRFYEMTIEHFPIRQLHITGTYITQITQKVLNDYGIYNKILIACTDNGTNMVKSFNTLPFQRIPCVCHCINTFVTHFIEALRDAIFAPIFSEQATLSKSTVFTQFCENMPDMSLSSIPSYTQTRWYSIYELLDHLKKMKTTIYKFYRRKRDNNGQLTLEELPDSEWIPIKRDLDDRIFNHVHSLKPFFFSIKKAYKQLESDKFGTISCIIPQYQKVLKQLDKLPQLYVIGVTAFKAAYQEYWNKYFTNFALVLFTATRLNPFIPHENFMTPEEIQKADTEIIRIMDQIRPNPQVPQRANQRNDSSSSSDDSDDDSEDDAPMTNSAALAYYVANRSYFEKDDLLAFWKGRKSDKKYSVLAQIAERILSIIITSASAERLFSSSARNTSYLRMRLSKDHVCDMALISGNKEIAIHEMEVNPLT